ncbi:MAG TPA: glutathione S-transferase family protein [Candidatus Cybelea sp.]|nr:glutathione S-transferase family protein [Candidatus Cybelea sp.]
MYTLYWSPGAASMAPQCCLEEAGVPYTLKLVDMSKGDHKRPEYLALNPTGKIPALAIDGSFVMSEAMAISMLIADRHPAAKLAPGPDELARGHYLMWGAYLTNTLQATMLEYYYPDRHTSAPDGTAAVAAKASETIAGIWQRIEAHLRGNGGPYLLGERFSAADPFCFMLSTWQECCPDTYARFPAVKRLADAVAARPAIARVVAVNQAA